MPEWNGGGRHDDDDGDLGCLLLIAAAPLVLGLVLVVGKLIWGLL